VLADRAYDADYVRAQLVQVGAEAVIPSKKNRKHLLDHDREIYKHRNQIEPCINRFKAYRGRATRCKKMASA
jgi:transposase